MVDKSEGGLRAALVDRALALLEQGEADVSLRAVARAAGVSAMAPYRHFTDKAALMAAVAAQGFAMLEANARKADAVANPAEALRGQGEAYIAFARAHPALFRLMFAERAGLAAPPGEGAGAYALMARRVTELAQGDAQPAILACWAVVHGLAMLALDGRIAPDPARERAALDLLPAAITR